uniref:7TM_GPCR_Srx domain-containing protein n=1 Tax=Strongyloides papillosus TaxID=174720 RepID=A0A0N5BZQ3_STREA
MFDFLAHFQNIQTHTILLITFCCIIFYAEAVTIVGAVDSETLLLLFASVLLSSVFDASFFISFSEDGSVQSYKNSCLIYVKKMNLL